MKRRAASPCARYCCVSRRSVRATRHAPVCVRNRQMLPRGLFISLPRVNVRDGRLCYSAGPELANFDSVRRRPLGHLANAGGRVREPRRFSSARWFTPRRACCSCCATPEVPCTALPHWRESSGGTRQSARCAARQDLESPRQPATAHAWRPSRFPNYAPSRKVTAPRSLHRRRAQPEVARRKACWHGPWLPKCADD